MSKKTSSIATAAVALALVWAGPARAQSTVSLRADVPFEFTAGNATMPAGEYRASSLGQPYVVALSARDGSAQALLLTRNADAGKASDQAKLVFHKYGDRYFLTEIWNQGLGGGHLVPVSSTERELTKRAARHEVVAVLAKR